MRDTSECDNGSFFVPWSSLTLFLLCLVSRFILSCHIIRLSLGPDINWLHQSLGVGRFAITCNIYAHSANEDVRILQSPEALTTHNVNHRTTSPNRLTAHNPLPI